MTTDEVRAAAEQSVDSHERFAAFFGRREAQDLASCSRKGLMTCPARKRIEPIARHGSGQVSGLQEFLKRSPRDGDDLRMEIQAVVADELVPTTDRWTLGTVGVVAGSGFTKQGTPSAGVARQHNGRLGEPDNCQGGVSLVGVTPAGTALVEPRLDLHEDWFEPEAGAQRRAEAPIPEDRPFLTEPQSAADLVRSVVVHDPVTLDWITADEVDGGDGESRDGREALERRSLVEVPVSTTAWTADPAPCVPASSGRGQPPKRPTREAVRPVAAVAASLPEAAWQTRAVREGATGPLASQCARVRAWAVRHRKAGPAAWLLIRRS